MEKFSLFHKLDVHIQRKIEISDKMDEQIFEKKRGKLMTRDDRIEELKKALSELDEEEQQAVMFIANRYKVMEEVSRAEKLAAEQHGELTKEAKKKGDAVLLGMVLLERILNGD